MDWNEEEITRLINFVISGQLKVKDIAKVLNRTLPSVRKKMISLNLRIVSENMDDREKVMRLYNKEEPIDSISDQTKLPIGSIKNIVKWGKEQGKTNLPVPKNKSKWEQGDVVRLTRMATLVDDRVLKSYLRRDIDIDKVIKQFWNINSSYLIGIEIEEFAEMFKVTEEDQFTIIMTTRDKKDGSQLMVVPWVDVDMFEAKNPNVDDLVTKMSKFQKLIYQEVDREKVILKIVKIIDRKYDDKDYYLVQ